MEQATGMGGACKVWAREPERFSTHRVSPIGHDFQHHPLMQLDALAALAHDLMPRRQCRFLKPGATQGSEFSHLPRPLDGRDLDQVFRDIEQPGAWIALYNVEAEPRYQAFVDEVLASARPLIEREQPGVFAVNGFIFISAPPSVTPFHIDRENNFWLQVRGRKTINVWEPTDRVTVPGAAVEDFIIRRNLRDVRYDEALRERSHEYDVGPGDGVYFPSTSPHMTRTDPSWARPGDGLSISIGVTFYTAVTRRHARVHQVNSVLRRVGLNPVQPGVSPRRDALKAAVGGWVGAARYRLSGLPVPPGAL